MPARDILNREPTVGEVLNNESIIVNDGVSGIKEILNIDGTLYTNHYINETDSGIIQTIGPLEVTEDSVSDIEGGVSWEGATLVIPAEGDSRVILGRLSTANNYGLKMLNSVGTSIFKFDTDAQYAEIAGWKFNNDSLWTSSAGNFPSDPDSAPSVYQGLIFSNVSGIQKMSLFNDNNNYLWWDGSVLRIKSEYFTLDETGNITATGGTIAGWDMGTNLLRSATSGTRIELNKAENRVSIFDDSSEQVVMGYLNNLIRGNGTGTASHGATYGLIDITQDWDISKNSYTVASCVKNGSTTITCPTNSTIAVQHNVFGDGIPVNTYVSAVNSPGDVTSMTISNSATDSDTSTLNFSTGEFKDLYLEVDMDDNDFASGTETKTITANNPTWIWAATFSGTTASHKYRVKYPSDSYGFWAAQGDQLAIDGDVIYENGDWLIQNNAAVRIFNGQGDEIIRLGTANTDEKGLFLFDGTGEAASDQLAKFISTGATIGNTSTEHIIISSASMLVKDGGDTMINIAGGSITLGKTATEKVVIDSTGVEVIGGTGAGGASHSVKLSSGNLLFNVGGNLFNYVFQQYIPEDILNFGSAFTFEGAAGTAAGLVDFPVGWDYHVVYIPKLLPTYFTGDTADNWIGFFETDKTEAGFTPNLRKYSGATGASASYTSGFTGTSALYNGNVAASSYNWNTAIDTSGEGREHYHAVNNPIGGAHVNKVTVVVRIVNDSATLDGTVSFFIRTGERNGTTNLWWDDADAYHEAVGNLWVDALSIATYSISSSWLSSTGDYDDYLLTSLVFRRVTGHASGVPASFDVTISSITYQRTPEFTDLSGTGHCAALCIANANSIPVP